MTQVEHLARWLAAAFAETATWLEHLGVESAVLGLWGAACLVATIYLALVGTVTLTTQLVTGPRSAEQAGLLTPWVSAGPIRRLAGVLTGPGLVASISIASATATGATGTGPTVPTMESAPADDPGEEAGESARPPTSAPTMRSTPEEEPAGDAVPADPGPVADEWLIQPGDHLWRVAEETVGEQLGTTDASAVAHYWHSLIETNRSRLADPHNPDLVYPGQRFVLPPVTGG